MQQNNNSFTKSPTTLPTRPVDVYKFLDHWAWELYAYAFATFFSIFALSCLVVLVQQCKQASHSRNTYGRFTTIQLFTAATLKAVGLLWSPIVLNDVSMGTFMASMLIDCFSTALSLSAFSILLLILLETTTTSLAAPRMQNIWVLLALTILFMSVTMTFNLLVLYADRTFWYFVSYLTLFVWGILICVGYTAAGYRMRRNLKSSRRLGNSASSGRLKNITALVFLSPAITVVSLILSLCLAASEYGIFVEVEINKETMWIRYAIMFLLRSSELSIVVLIFGIVIRTKSRGGSVEDAPTVQLGTFVEDTTTG